MNNGKRQLKKTHTTVYIYEGFDSDRLAELTKQYYGKDLETTSARQSEKISLCFEYKSMSINYVIATYNGHTKRTHSHPLPADVLKAHLSALGSRMTTLAQITIMAAESPMYYEGYYDIKEVTDKFDIPVVVVKCENYGYSPGQWLKAYEKYTDGFDYYVFIEDDYCPGMSGFDNILKSAYSAKFGGGEGLLCSLVEGSKQYKSRGGHPLHFEGAVFASSGTLKRLYQFYHPNTPRVLLDKMDSKACPGYNWERLRSGYLGGYYQVSFSHIFTIAGIEHEDYLDGGRLQFPYWDDRGGICFYDKGDKRRTTYTLDEVRRSPIIPVQLANSSFIAHHTPLDNS
jgi:hypothetical protein